MPGNVDWVTGLAVSLSCVMMQFSDDAVYSILNAEVFTFTFNYYSFFKKKTLVSSQICNLRAI